MPDRRDTSPARARLRARLGFLTFNTHVDAMDALHYQLQRIEKQLAWVQTEPIDWKLLVQCFTWAVTCWELYLL